MFCLLYKQNKILLGDRRQHLFDEYIQDLTNKALLNSREYVDARRRLCVRSSNIVTFFLNPPWNELANMNWSCAEIYMLFLELYQGAVFVVPWKLILPIE